MTQATLVKWVRDVARTPNTGLTETSAEQLKRLKALVMPELSPAERTRLEALAHDEAVSLNYIVD
jgi:hypothetical protein